MGGDYDGFDDVWLRWGDRNGVMLATGPEAKLQEQARTKQERQRAEILADKLRELGIDPQCYHGRRCLVSELYARGWLEAAPRPSTPR